MKKNFDSVENQEAVPIGLSRVFQQGGNPLPTLPSRQGREYGGKNLAGVDDSAIVLGRDSFSDEGGCLCVFYHQPHEWMVLAGDVVKDPGQVAGG